MIPGTLFAQFVLPPNVEQENDGTGHTEPNQPETQSISQGVLRCLTLEEYVPDEGSTSNINVGSGTLTMR